MKVSKVIVAKVKLDQFKRTYNRTYVGVGAALEFFTKLVVCRSVGQTVSGMRKPQFLIFSSNLGFRKKIDDETNRRRWTCWTRWKGRRKESSTLVGLLLC